MVHNYRLITFDVYTALFDVEGSLARRAAEALGDEAAARALVRAWRRRQMEYLLISNSLEQGRVPFAVVTRRALDDSLHRAGLQLPQAAQEAWMAAWETLRPWPEADEVLRTLAERGHRLGLLSNGDEAGLRALAGRLAVPVAHIFAAEQAGRYKPHPAVYALPRQQLGLGQHEVLHVAGSVTDVMGTKAAGLACAWSNRQGEQVLDPALRADFTFEDLRGVLSVVG